MSGTRPVLPFVTEYRVNFSTGFRSMDKANTGMETTQVPFVCPDYLQIFSCIGARCEDNCCRDWDVVIDEATYRSYQTIGDRDLRNSILKCLCRQEHAGTILYAITRRPDGSCSFLTDDSLCFVQKELGAKALGLACAMYPRIANRIGQAFEESLLVSCPEAARLVLLNPQGISFREADRTYEKTGRIHTQRTISPQSMEKADGVEQYIPSLRRFTISLLKNRDFPVADRLVMLGMFCANLLERVRDACFRDFPSVIEHYQTMLSDPKTKESLAEIPTNITLQIRLLKEIAEQRIKSGNSLAPYTECYEEFTKGIKYTPEAAMEDVTEEYMRAYTHYYRPFMEGREYILENFLVNHVFRNVFPLVTAEYTGFFDDYIFMAINFALIKMHLIGMAGFHRQLTDELVIKIVYSIARAIEHNSDFVQRIMRALKKEGYATLGHMAVLIKN